MLWIWNIIAVIALSVLLAGIMIPQILLISFRRKLFDEPDKRKIHTSLVPRLGGMAFMPVVFISMALILGIDLAFGLNTEIPLRMAYSAQTVMFCFSSVFILYLVGLADDLVGVRYRAKFVVQIFCSFLLIAGGLAVSDLHGVLTITNISWYLAWPLTLLLTVFVINAINLIDGIDGLASGLSSVGVACYGIVLYLAGAYIYAMFAAAVLGVLVPFFYYNVFGNPQKQKKIFMGDTGSLSIGLFMCILAFKIIGTEAPSGHADINMLIVAMSPLVIPCFDVIRVYFYRLRHGRNPFLPDKNHIHHRLLAMGWSQRMAMLSIVGASAVFTIGNIILSAWLNVNIIILIDATIWIVVWSIIPKYVRRHIIAVQAQNPELQEMLKSETDDEVADNEARKLVREYIKTHPGEIKVRDIMYETNIEKMRLYSVLSRMKYAGKIREVKCDSWGKPEIIELNG